MTLRRISLTLALLTAPAWADDLDDLDDSTRGSARAPALEQAAGRAPAALEDVLFRPDGSIESVTAASGGPARRVPWTLVRLVLPDVASADRDEPPTRVEVAPRPAAHVATSRGDARALVSLRSLTGISVADASGAAIGLVRGALVSVHAGQAPALVVDLRPQDGSAPRSVAVPWSMLDVVDAARSGIARIEDEDARWLHAAPGLEDELARSGRALDRPLSPRLDGRESPDPLFDAWSDPR